MITPSEQDPKPKIDFMVDTTVSTQLTNPQKTIQITPATSKDYLKTCHEIWNTKALLTAYQKGLFMGRGEYSNVLFSEFLKKFRKMFEEIIREELQSTNQTSESFKDDFRALEHLFNMILTHAANHKIELKNEKTVATLHGFINSYVDPIINSNKET